MKLSVVMIIYNTELSYVRAALESIRRSTLRDCEICMVDDGSTVDYTTLAAEFGARLHRQENGGMLAARLAGIEMATGDYVTFVDSDDTVTVDYHRPMLDMAAATDADIVINDWAFHTERTRYACRGDSLISTDVMWEGRDVIGAFVAQEGREHSYYVVWNKIYRAALIKSVRESLLSGTHGRERMVYGEDALLNFYAYRDAKKLCNVHTGYYFYRIHAAQSVNVTSEEKLLGQIRSMGRVFAQMEEGLEGHPEREELLRHIGEWKALMSRSHYSHASANKFEALYPVIREVYGVEELKKSTRRDGAAYYKARLLPNNIEEIDAALRPLFENDAPTSVKYQRGDRYTAKTIARLAKNGKIRPGDANAAYVIPAEDIRLRDRILHNDIVYTIGVTFFKKGSRLRALLKRIL